MVDKGGGYYILDESYVPDFSKGKVTIVLINEIGLEVERETYYNIEPHEALRIFAEENPCIDKGDSIKII